jgi:hypothetical protein
MSQKRAPVPSSSSSEAEIPLDSAEAASDRADSHGYASEASHLSRQPSEHHRSSPGRTSPGSSHERPYQSSPERTSPLQTEQPEDDLQFVSHQDPTKVSSDEAVNPASILGDGKFTVPRSSGFSTLPGSSRPQAPESPIPRAGDTVNSVLLVGEQQQQQQSTPELHQAYVVKQRNSWNQTTPLWRLLLQRWSKSSIPVPGVCAPPAQHAFGLFEIIRISLTL